MRSIRTLLLLASLAVSAPLAAGAQTASPNPLPPATQGAPDCANKPGQDLSHSCGVIIPPATGDRNVKPAPSAGSMPVIPPPGTPGGDPQVQPK